MGLSIFLYVLFGFLFGFTFGGLSIIIFGLYSYKKQYKQIEKMLKHKIPLPPSMSAIKKVKNEVSINSRLSRAQEITEQQLNILYSLEAPQQNSLDGEHKNRMYHEVKRLEKEKWSILQSIVDDGHNPRVAIVDQNGELQKIYLKDYVVQSAKQEEVAPRSTTKTPPRKSKPNLTLVKDKED